MNCILPTTHSVSHNIPETGRGLRTGQTESFKINVRKSNLRIDHEEQAVQVTSSLL